MVVVILWVFGLFPFDNLQLSDLAGIESHCSFEVPAARARPGVQMMNHEDFFFSPVILAIAKFLFTQLF